MIYIRRLDAAPADAKKDFDTALGSVEIHLELMTAAAR